MSATAPRDRRARYPRYAFSIEVKLFPAKSATYSHDIILDTKPHYVAG